MKLTYLTNLANINKYNLAMLKDFVIDLIELSSFYYIVYWFWYFIYIINLIFYVTSLNKKKMTYNRFRIVNNKRKIIKVMSLSQIW